MCGDRGGAYDPQIRITMHLATKFHHPMFSRSEVTVLTNKHTYKQTDAVENIHFSNQKTNVTVKKHWQNVSFYQAYMARVADRRI